MRTFTASLIAAVIASRLAAGTITVVISTTFATDTYTSSSPPGPVVFGSGTNPDITIDLGAVSSLVTVRIFDDVTLFANGNNVPAAGIGRLKLIGSSSSTGRVNLLIADGDEGFPSTFEVAETLPPGLTSLGGTLNTNASSNGGLAHDYDVNPWLGTNTPPTSATPFTAWGNADLCGIIIENPTLRRQTVLAAVVAGDICPGFSAEVGTRGRIEVGQVLRLSARRTDVTGEIVGGDINADVIAVARDQYLTYGDIGNPPIPLGFAGVVATTTGFRSIESVTAGNAIRGSVIAQGRAMDDGLDAQGAYVGARFNPREEDPEPTQLQQRLQWLDKKWINRGSIFNIRVGPSESAEGFFGDIESKQGRIYSVRSTGEISGTQIKAADGVLEVRIHNWKQTLSATQQEALAKNLTVSTIQASSPYESIDNGPSVQYVGNAEGDDYATTLAKARNQGAIHLIETKGSFTGTVNCTNLIDDGTAAHRDALGRAGVIVWDHKPPQNGTGPRTYPDDGGISAVAVNVDHLAHNICVLAPSIMQMHVGWQLKGTVVAFGMEWSINGARLSPHHRQPGVSDIALLGGDINSLFVGSLAQQSDTVKAADRYRYRGMLPGFVGGFRPPVNLDPFDPDGVDGTNVQPMMLDERVSSAVNEDGSLAEENAVSPLPHQHPLLWDHDRYLWSPTRVDTSQTLGRYARDGGSLDSVIRAEVLIQTKCYVYGMHQRVFDIDFDTDPATFSHAPEIASYRARIEAPIINALSVGNNPDSEFERRAGISEGVVWSGSIEYWPVQDQPGRLWSAHTAVSYWYPRVQHNAFAYRVGPGGDVWGDPLALNVARDMCGELHASMIYSSLFAGPADIAIGDRLGRQDDWYLPVLANGAYVVVDPVYGITLGDPAYPGAGQPATEKTPRGSAVLGPKPSPLTGFEFEADVAALGGVYVGLHDHEHLPADPAAAALVYATRELLEHSPGIMLNYGFARQPEFFDAGEWDTIAGTTPVQHDWAKAWRGFVRVGDPWAFRQLQDAGVTGSPYRVITLAQPGTTGTIPAPDAVLDRAPEYNRHGWELTGAENRIPNRLSSSIAVLPFSLHVQDCSPPPPVAQIVPPPPAPSPFDDPDAYHYLLLDDWIAHWPPPLSGITGADIIEPWGYEYLPRIRLRFYGQVTTPFAGEGAQVPVRIEELKYVNNVPLWVPLSLTGPDNFFAFTIGAVDPNSTLTFPSSDLYLGPRCNAVARQGYYKITLHPATDETVTNRLYCFVSNQSPVYQPRPFTYYLHLVGRGCADIGITGGVPGHDGVWDNNDFIVFIDYYFEHNPLADVGTTGGIPGSDGVWDNNDFVVFIDQFFSHEGCTDSYTDGCEPGLAGRAPGGGEGGASLNGPAGSGEGMTGQAEPQSPTRSATEQVAQFRMALQQMIATEPPGPRRDQLLEMLNALPPAQP